MNAAHAVRSFIRNKDPKRMVRRSPQSDFEAILTSMLKQCKEAGDCVHRTDSARDMPDIASGRPMSSDALRISCMLMATAGSGSGWALSVAYRAFTLEAAWAMQMQ